MKHLSILVLTVGLFFSAYGGCGACGGDHGHSHDTVHSHDAVKKSAKSSCCSVKDNEKAVKSCCKKEKKRSCASCTSCSDK